MELTEVIELIAETGIALLLFLVGLELNLDKIKDVGPAVLPALALHASLDPARKAARLRYLTRYWRERAGRRSREPASTPSPTRR